MIKNMISCGMLSITLVSHVSYDNIAITLANKDLESK